MDRLSLVLTLITGSVLVGSFLIVILSLGFYHWLPIAAAIVLGLGLTWPTAYAISRWIKHKDPGWPPPSGSDKDKRERKSDFPET